MNSLKSMEKARSRPILPASVSRVSVTCSSSRVVGGTDITVSNRIRNKKKVAPPLGLGIPVAWTQ